MYIQKRIEELRRAKAGKQKPETPELFQLVIDCRDETDQRKLYDRLRNDGYKCKVVTM